MNALLKLSRFIDGVTDRIGQLVSWGILAAVLISSGNASYRYIMNNSSNAWLELQWYLFSAVFLLCAGYALLHNSHVRIDVIAGRLSKRTQMWIDIFGTVFFLLPMAILIMWLAWPVFMNAYVHDEVSSNAGGLKIWPARLLMPVGFFLLIFQAVSEIIKRVAFLQGLIPDPTEKREVSAEEELAEEIRKMHGGKP